MKQALMECHLYNRMGGLDDELMQDIAHDYDVDFEELKRLFEQ